MTELLIKDNWVNDPRVPPQSGSAQAFVAEYRSRRPEAAWDEAFQAPKIVGIILDHNADPHDTDLIGTVIALIDYIEESR